MAISSNTIVFAAAAAAVAWAGSMDASLSPKSFYLLNSVHVEHVCTKQRTGGRTDGRTDRLSVEPLRHLEHVREYVV